MSALGVNLVAQIALSCASATTLPASRLTERVVATALTESGLQVTALHDNTTGISYRPGSESKAAALATTLRLQGHSIDAGIMQINDANWNKLGITAETVFDYRLNICAGVQIIADAYNIERRVSCRYNTGRPNCANGYPERIEASSRQIHAEIAASTSILRDHSSAPLPKSSPDPFIVHAAAREMCFTSTVQRTPLLKRDPPNQN